MKRLQQLESELAKVRSDIDALRTKTAPTFDKTLPLFKWGELNNDTEGLAYNVCAQATPDRQAVQVSVKGISHSWPPVLSPLDVRRLIATLQVALQAVDIHAGLNDLDLD
jgi:hypothetical protein